MPPPDKRRPFPDKAHEDLATWAEETIADLGNNRADTDDSFMLVDVLFGLLDQALADVADAVTEREALRADMNALVERVTALEAAHAPLPGPDAAG